MTYPNPYEPGDYNPRSPGYGPGFEEPKPRRSRGIDLLLWLVLAACLMVFVLSPMGLGILLPAERSIPEVADERAQYDRAIELVRPDGDFKRALPSPPAELVEDVDYSLYLGDGDFIVHWSCAEPIAVRIAGSAPTGAREAVLNAIDLVVEVSGLPLYLAGSLPEPIEDSEDVPHGEIAISFLLQDDFENAMTGYDDDYSDALGVAGPHYNASSGRIRSAHILMSEHSDPRTRSGQHTVLHELMHAVGIGHADQSAHKEVMRPRLSLHDNTNFGPGDSFALEAVGCY